MFGFSLDGFNNNSDNSSPTISGVNNFLGNDNNQSNSSMGNSDFVASNSIFNDDNGFGQQNNYTRLGNNQNNNVYGNNSQQPSYTQNFWGTDKDTMFGRSMMGNGATVPNKHSMMTNYDAAKKYM